MGFGLCSGRYLRRDAGSILGSGMVSLIILAAGFGGFQTVYAQGGSSDYISDDYEIFGRKVPISLGSAFSTLARFGPFENPAELALVVDNSIAFDLSASDRGTGKHISFSAPNFSISSSQQEVNDVDGSRHTKKLLRFAFGFALGDPAPLESRALALGLAVSNKFDRAGAGGSFFSDTTFSDTTDSENTHTLAANLGLIFKFGRSQVNITLLDVLANEDYSLRMALGFRTYTSFGLQLSIQGMPGWGYGSDPESSLGLRLGLAQSFFNARLVSRMQLESFFTKDGEATMQNITAGVGYRLQPGLVTGGIAVLLDTEFSYTLSFLAVPNIIGTHMFAVVKYF